jgi:predicted O-methyltransferase YrrM
MRDGLPDRRQNVMFRQMHRGCCVQAWIAKLFENKDLLRMGHLQRAEDNNLGLGWIYYALARTLRPKTVVSIGSWRGFVPMVLAKALADNAEGGEVVFIDPSLVDDFWRSPDKVTAHFAAYGIDNIRHFLNTTQEFVETDAYRGLGPVGMLFVDGYHSAEQARYDYEAFREKLTDDAIVLFHDSVAVRTARIYGPDRHYDHRVVDYMDDLKKDPTLQLFDLDFGGGVTLARKVRVNGGG